MSVVTLFESNLRDPAATLRRIADKIDAGEFGDVECVGVSILGDELAVFGCGPHSEAPSTAMVLHAGFQFLHRQMFNPDE